MDIRGPVKGNVLLQNRLSPEGTFSFLVPSITAAMATRLGVPILQLKKTLTSIFHVMTQSKMPIKK